MEKVYYVLNRISNVICRILCIVGFMIVILNFGSVLLQVINRYVIVKISDLSFPWTEEMARYSMIWLCYVILPVVYREGAMAQLDLIFDHVGKGGRMALYVITRILCLVFIVLAVYHGVHIVETRILYKSSILRAPGYMLYSAPIFGCVLVGYEIITEMIGVFAGVLRPFSAGERRKFSFFRPKEQEEGSDSV